MYHTRKNPLRKVTRTSDEVFIAKGLRQRRLHKAFLRYHDPNNWPVLREALRRMGRGDLIGNSKQHLIPTWQPAGTGAAPEGARHKRAGHFKTQHIGLPTTPVTRSPRANRGAKPKPPKFRGR
jgi:hypothetical protein